MSATFSALKSAVPSLTARDQVFANSLLDQWSARGNLSAKQLYWVDTLVERAANGGERTAPTPAAEGIALAPIAAMFRKAALKLKYPKIDIMVGRTALTLSLAGAASRNPGFIYVKRSGQYQGKVSPDGAYTGNAEIVPQLQEIAKDPAGAAANHGHLHGNCCFCKIPLTDERSIAVGYGKVCAGHYQLPWGKAATKAQEEREAA